MAKITLMAFTAMAILMTMFYIPQITQELNEVKISAGQDMDQDGIGC